MSLLGRYKGHRSSLSMSVPRDAAKSSMHKVFLSYKNPTLSPLENVLNEADAKSKNNSGKAVSTEELPDADDVLPITNQDINHVDLKIEKPCELNPSTSVNFSEAFMANVNACKNMCDFASDAFDVEAKAIKSNAMNSILFFISTPGNFNKLGDENYKALIEMAELHVFRSLQRIEEKFLFSDDIVVITEVSMPHISIAYQIMAVFIEYDNKLDYQWIKKVISRFAAPDKEEAQEIAKLVMKWTLKHKMEKEMKKMMCDVLSVYQSKQNTPHTVIPALIVLSQLLDLPNDKYILDNYILPLLGAPHIVSFSKEVFTIMDMFCENDQTLHIPVIHSLIYHWPKTRSSKLIIFLNQMTTLLTHLKAKDFKELRVPIFKLYGSASCSLNYRVAEAAHSVWTKLPLEPLIMDSARFIFPLVYTPIRNALNDHWSSSVIDTMNATLESMSKIDSFLFQELCRNKIQTEEKDLVRLWAVVSRAAMHQDRNLNLASKLSEIQKIFTKTNQQTTQNTKPALHSPANNTNKRVVQPQVLGRLSRSGRF